jgi:hypothetical protein
VNSVRTVPTQPKLPVSNTEHAISKKRSREPSELVQESCSLDRTIGTPDKRRRYRGAASRRNNAIRRINHLNKNN